MKIKGQNAKAWEPERTGLFRCGAIHGETAIAVTGRPVAGSIPTSSIAY